MTNIITIASYSLKRSFSIILGWGIPLMLLGIITIPFYDLVAENEKQLRPVLDTLKPLLKSFVGGDEAAQVFTPEGFIALRYFAFLPVVMGIFGSVYGSGLLAADEERGILDFLMAHPISRSQIFWGRLLSFLLILTLIIGFGWFGLWLGVLKAESMNFSPVKLWLPYLSVFAVTWLFACLSLALSMVMPSRSAAAMFSGIIVLAGYIITNLSKAIKGLESWALFSPITYFQSNAMMGLKLNPLTVLFVSSIIFVAFAWKAFVNRDIRVAGDGGWKIPFLGSR
ncbi:MAG: ABC transporter permease subunit [Verrucomicrobiota bacterium]|nr:ABC transporter permease subunit [Verrucomicrobiota bacterium]